MHQLSTHPKTRNPENVQQYRNVKREIGTERGQIVHEKDLPAEGDGVLELVSYVSKPS